MRVVSIASKGRKTLPVRREAWRHGGSREEGKKGRQGRRGARIGREWDVEWVEDWKD